MTAALREAVVVAASYTYFASSNPSFKSEAWFNRGFAVGRRVPLYDNAVYIAAMIRIAVSLAAYEAIVATLPDDRTPRAPMRLENGDCALFLDHRTIDRLTRLRGPRESYSDVILRLTAADEWSSR